MTSPSDDSPRALLGLPLSRREWLRVLLTGCGLCLVSSYPRAGTAAQSGHRSVLEKFLGEELTYQLGFWLFSRCGEARTCLVETGQAGFYRASLEGQTLGFVDWLAGQYRFSYVSYMMISGAGNRFRPHHFLHTVRRMGKERHTTVAFDYSKRELLFSRILYNGEKRQEREVMKRGIVYEDYMTLFYNFRNGCYGPLKRGHTYHLPIHVHKGMKSLEVSIASREEEERERQREPNKANKDFFLRFRINPEDVSSESGEIEGWLSSDAVPIKGKIKDVILFGDLWGDLIKRWVRST